MKVGWREWLLPGRDLDPDPSPDLEPDLDPGVAPEDDTLLHHTTFHLSLTRLMRRRRGPGLSRESTRVILKVSILTACILIALFLAAYTVLLAYVHSSFWERPQVPYRKRLHGKMKSEGYFNHPRRKQSLINNHTTDTNVVLAWNYSEMFSPQVLPMCIKNTVFTILITSSVNHSDRREAIRETWCNPRAFGLPANSWQCAFLIGRTVKEVTLAELTKEKLKHGDILVGNYVDTYRNLTLKVLHGFHWSVLNCSSDYVVKTDDDCFVNVKLLFNILNSINKKKTNLYVGNAVTKPEKLKVVRNHERWAVSVEQYKEDSYPPYASGIGYILSKDVAQKLVAYSQYVHPFPNEDAYVGVVLSQAEVKVTSSARFSVSSSGLSMCNLVYLLILHDVPVVGHKHFMNKSLAAQQQCQPFSGNTWD